MNGVAHPIHVLLDILHGCRDLDPRSIREADDRVIPAHSKTRIGVMQHERPGEQPCCQSRGHQRNAYALSYRHLLSSFPEPHLFVSPCRPSPVLIVTP
jgi:hypothetical protein